MIGRNDFLARKNWLVPDQCYKLEKIIRASPLTFIIHNCNTKKSLLGSDWTWPLRSTLRLPVSPTCKSPELPSGQTPPGPCSRQVNNEHTSIDFSSSLKMNLLRVSAWQNLLSNAMLAITMASISRALPWAWSNFEVTSWTFLKGSCSCRCGKVKIHAHCRLGESRWLTKFPSNCKNGRALEIWKSRPCHAKNPLCHSPRSQALVQLLLDSTAFKNQDKFIQKHVQFLNLV